MFGEKFKIDPLKVFYNEIKELTLLAAYYEPWSVQGALDTLTLYSSIVS